MAPLDLPVADAYYFISHEYMGGTGRCRLHPRVLGIGLGAALLGELVLTGNLDVHEGSVYVTRRTPPCDRHVRAVLETMIALPQHRELRTWLAYLAEEIASDQVVGRLHMRRLLTEVHERRLIRTRRALVPTDINIAAWQEVRLARLLNTRRVGRHADAFLAGLVDATNLTSHVLWDPETSAEGRALLPLLIKGLDPAFGSLVSYTRAAVGGVALAPR